MLDDSRSAVDRSPSRAAVGADVAHGIDAVVQGPVLVVGSLPPAGRDLDLLAGPGDAARVRTWLVRSGFVPGGDTWARMHGPGPYAVDLATTGPWRTSRDDGSVLFEDAESIAGFRHLVRPGPATVLLLAARSIVRLRGAMTDKVRERVTEALERDGEAWTNAGKRARDLGLAGALELLRRAVDADRRLSPAARASGLVGVLTRGGPVVASSRVLLAAAPRRVRPAVVSFSGLDGSGKSTQVALLQQNLRSLGREAETEWAGLKTGRKLRKAVPLLDRPPGGHQQAPRSPDLLVPAALRNRPVMTQAWVYFVVGGNAVLLWSRVMKRRPGTRVLIFDRFSPDTMVKLDLNYQQLRHIDTRWQRRLFALLCPKPDVGFFVDVPSDVAGGRRPEEPVDRLALTAGLYEEQAPRFGLHRLDGTEPEDALARRVAVAVWGGLR